MTATGLKYKVRELYTLALAPFLALVIGLSILHQFQSTPFARVLMSDEDSYTRWALDLLAGRGLPPGPLYQDPLYPGLLALWFGVFGAAPLGVRLAQILLGAAAVLLTGLAGRRMIGPAGGTVATALLALCASLYYFELQVSKETLVIFLSALALWLGARAGEENKVQKAKSNDGVAHPFSSPRENGWVHRFPAAARWIPLGLCLGLLCLCRGNFLLVAPLVAAWALARGTDRRAAARAAALFCLGVALPVAPVAARNTVIAREFVLVTYSGGHNLYLGNNPDADGSYVVPRFAAGDPFTDPESFRKEAERRTGEKFSDPAAARFWTGEALRWLLDHPGPAARLYTRKLFLLLNQRELPNLYSLDLLRGRFVRLLWLPFLGYGLLWGPALVGALALWRRPAARFAVILAIGYTGSLLPFFIVDRYRAPLLPALAILAAGGIDSLAREWRGGGRKKAMLATVTAVALIAVGLWPVVVPDSTRASEAALAGDAFRRAGDPARALAWYDEARRIAPEDGTIWHGWALSVTALGPNDLGLLRSASAADDPIDLFQVAKRFEQLEQYQDAAHGFERVVALDPDDLRASLHLVNIYLKTGDRAKAMAWANDATLIAPTDAEAWDALDRAAAR